MKKICHVHFKVQRELRPNLHGRIPSRGNHREQTVKFDEFGHECGSFNQIKANKTTWWHFSKLDNTSHFKWQSGISVVNLESRLGLVSSLVVMARCRILVLNPSHTEYVMDVERVSLSVFLSAQNRGFRERCSFLSLIQHFLQQQVIK